MEEKRINTGINTWIDKDRRISSIYRHFGNPHFSIWAWETFLWNGDKIEKEYKTRSDANQVVALHQTIVADIKHEEV